MAIRRPQSPPGIRKRAGEETDCEAVTGRDRTKQRNVFNAETQRSQRKTQRRQRKTLVFSALSLRSLRLCVEPPLPDPEPPVTIMERHYVHRLRRSHA